VLRFKLTERQPRGAPPQPEIIGIERHTVFAEHPPPRPLVVLAGDDLLPQAGDGEIARSLSCGLVEHGLLVRELGRGEAALAKPLDARAGR
jgi:hypothetical protein